jgi:hypothetical protein
MSTSPEPLPSIYRSKQAFLASLPPWRRLLQKLNWRPTIDTCVQIYAIEQELAQMRKQDELLQKEDEQLRKEDERMRKEDEQRQQEDERLRKLDARLAELDARFDAIVSRSCSNSTPPTPDKPAT